MQGNVVLWKPSDTAVLSNYIIYEILEEAGLPQGVIAFLPSDGPTFGKAICDSKHLAAVNFTGSVPTYQWLLRSVAENQDKYLTFPKMVGGRWTRGMGLDAVISSLVQLQSVEGRISTSSTRRPMSKRWWRAL